MSTATRAFPVEPLAKVRTKIVATVGPASRDPAVLRALAMAGVDLFRLNFSHGTHDDHTAAIGAIRGLSRELDRPIAVLQDLGGPKLRLGPVENGLIACEEKARFVLATAPDPLDPAVLSCTHADLPRELSVGESVLFADGTVGMQVVGVDRESGRATLEVTLPGPLRSRQGLNLPQTALKIPAITEKDLADLGWAALHRPDFIALSFVRSAADVLQLRGELEARGVDARIVAKIEKPQALGDLDAILAATDAVMVARGDLGVEMDVARVPAAQKKILDACRKARVPAITATQMLNSMEHSNRPTRAEATDVFNAVLDGTDALMLSGETAIGEYPVDAVAMMSRIAAEAEALLDAGKEAAPPTRRWVSPITEAVVEAAGLTCRRLNAAVLAVWTHSGRTALALSKLRHPTPTLAIADDERVARAMALFWGVTPIHQPHVADAQQAMQIAVGWARDRGLVGPGDRVVLIRGMVPGNPVQNALLVHEVL
ncbi:MAG: pyruvate kinase [Isosphaeraceae bacterium]